MTPKAPHTTVCWLATEQASQCAVWAVVAVPGAKTLDRSFCVFFYLFLAMFSPTVQEPGQEAGASRAFFGQTPPQVRAGVLWDWDSGCGARARRLVFGCVLFFIRGGGLANGRRTGCRLPLNTSIAVLVVSDM